VTVKLFQFNRLYILVGLKNGILLRYKWPLISTLVAPLSFLQLTLRKHGCGEQFITNNFSSRDEATGKEDALLITLHLIIIQRIGVCPISFIITLSDRPWLLQIAKHN
jgi:splicing factor 3B subunit 3